MAESRDFIKHVAEIAKEKQYAEFSLLLKKWRDLKEMIYILGIPFRATIALQNHKLTLSDTFGIWLEIKLHLQKVIQSKMSKTTLDVELLQAFNRRYDAIFANPVMKAAIYLDPRFRKEIIRNQDAVETAKDTIINIKRRLQFLDSQELHETPKNNGDVSSDDS